MGISFSAATRASVNALADIQEQMNAAQLRIGTGKRVNSALDDPAAFFTASALSGRAASLNTLFDKIANAQSALTAATKAISTIQSLLSTAQTLASQALLSVANQASVTGTNSSALTTGTTIASTGGSSTRLRSGDTITVSDGTTTATYTASSNDSVQTFLNAVNGASGIKITASLDTSGKIHFAGTDSVSITIGGSINGAGGGTLNGITGLTAGTTAPATNTLRASMAVQYDSLRTQINQAVQDANYNGVNLLNGSSLSVEFNETGTSSLNITGTTVTASGIGMTASAGSFQSDANINSALTSITTALASLQTTSLTLSSMGEIMDSRKEFNQSLVNIIEAGADLLTATDTSADSAMLLALQSRQQLLATSMSISQGSDTTALRLLGR